MLDTVFHILKLSAIIAVSTVFGLAIYHLVSLITTLVFHNVIGEVFALISMYLPFNAFVVFWALGSACTSILAFMIAKKIFDLTSWSISSV